MNVYERIQKAKKNFDAEQDNIEKIIAMAYYFGREEAAKDVCETANKIFKEQEERAKKCRYNKMAKEVIGNKRIYTPDYAGTMIETFKNDKTEI